jgi:Holliday junction resolvase
MNRKIIGKETRDEGLQFEKELAKAFVEKGCWVLPISDYGLGEKPPDLLVIGPEKNLLIECKTTKSGSFNSSEVKLHQVKNLVNFKRIKCCNYGYVAVNFLAYGYICFIDIHVLAELVNNSGSKKIDFSTMQENSKVVSTVFMNIESLM